MVLTRTIPLSSRFKALLLLALLAGFGCDKPAPAPPPAEVVTVTLAPQNVPEKIQFVPQVESSHQVEILARVNGFLDKIAYKEGSLIKAGKVMFRMDPKPFEAAVASAKGEVASREAQLWTAKANLDRVKALAALDGASRSDLDIATGSVQAAEASLYSARASLDKALLDLSNTTLHAPISGLAGEASFREGTYLTAGATGRLSYVAKLDPIRVTFSVSPEQMVQFQQEIATGQQVSPPNMDYQFELELADGSLYPHEGILNFTAPIFNPETGTFRVRAELPNPQGILRPGIFVKATVKGAVHPNTIVVPQHAIQETSNGQIVFLASPQGGVEVRPVVVGKKIDSDQVILKGLKAGEQVITEGFQKLKPGDPIKVVNVQKQPVASVQAATPTPDGKAATTGKPRTAPPTPAKVTPHKPEPDPQKPAPSAKPVTKAPAPTKKSPATPEKSPESKVPQKSSAVTPAEPTLRQSILVSKAPPASRPAAAPSGSTVPSGQLLLGMLANHDEAMAKQYAANLEKALGQPVAVRMFEDEETLVKWFQHYRMLDLAIIPSNDRSDILSGDYQLLQSAKQESLVARRDLPADLLKKLTQGLASSRQPDSSQVMPVPHGGPSHA